VLVSEFPDLHALLCDIAARGRSLGIHLLLGTQRPAAVARDGVLANADLRISLRVNNRGDSAAVVGSDDAARILPTQLGRAILALAGSTGRPVQIAIARADDVLRARDRWPGPWLPRKPWCEPLPERVLPVDLAAGAFCLVDLPELQRQDAGYFDPLETGHVLVLGDSGAGKSTALSALAADGLWLPRDPEGAWDALDDPAPRLCVIDDLDSLLPRFGDDHRSAFLERLGNLLRDGPALGIRFAMSAARITGELQSIASLTPSRLLLRLADKHEFVAAGGNPLHHRAGTPAGRASWRGLEVQVVLAPVRGATPSPRPRLLAIERPLAVVTTRAAWVTHRLKDQYSVTPLADSPAAGSLRVGVGASPTAVVGSPDDWQSRWGALGALSESSDIVFDRCSVSEFRALSRSRALPPPLALESNSCWLLRPDGRVDRVRLPGD
jgi:S-DNA-T family DNA segregation ATPase FtsK/SpoIIIE